MRSIVIDGTRAARVRAAGGVGVWGGEETKKQNTEKCARATHRPTGSGSLLEAPWSRDGGLTITIVPRAQASRSRRRASVSHGTAAAEAHTEAALALSLFPSWSSPLLSRPLLLLLRRCWCSLCARCLLACSLALTLPGLLLLLLVRCCSAVFDVAVVDAAKHLLCCSVFWLCSCVCRRDSRHLLALVLMARISPPTRSRLATP